MSTDLPVRKSIRLPDYDYSQNGWYFVTICTQDRKKILGKIVGGNLYKSPVGHIANWEWVKLRLHFPQIILDEFIIMPNHIHGIIRIRATVKVAPTLGHIIGAYKSLITHDVIEWANKHNHHIGQLWQRNYYEHIIRDENDMNRIREYIQNNPANWSRDKFHSFS